VLLAWSAVAVVVQRWASIAEGIRVGYAVDVTSYLVIAEAAPSLPDDGLVLRPYAERFPVHWLAGTVSDLTGLGLETVYRLSSVLVVAGMLVAAHATLSRLELGTRAHVLALGALAASAYPLHYLLAAPGMVSDGVFVLGLALTLLGFVRGSFAVVVVGLLVAVLGRQTAVPVVVAAAAWVAVAPAWRATRWRRAAATLLVPGLVYLVVRTIADGFAVPRVFPLEESTALGYLDSLDEIADHLGRIVLGIAMPAALVAGAWLRVRGPLPRGALLLAAVIVAQPFVLGPATNGFNEPRLAGLAAPALVVAAAALLRRARLSSAETAVIAAAILLAGLHPRYTWPPPWGSGVWAALEVTAAAAACLLLALSGRMSSASLRARPVGE
jgi:hypothetical protein